MSGEVPKRIADRYEINKKLGEGSFGQVFRGVDLRTDTPVAIKFEEAGTQGLKNEAELLKKLRRPDRKMRQSQQQQQQQQQDNTQHQDGPPGFAEIYHFSEIGKWSVMVMELLGKSLEDCVQEQRDCKFEVGTTALVAEQILHRIEYLHSRGIVHRDIKPENFMWGIGNKVHHLYLIDFGLSVKYFSRKHVSMSRCQSLTGTARYASINAHKGYTQSRRDDLEAIGHMLLYFLRGSLPWSGLKARSQEDKFRKIMETKANYPLNELCRGFPPEFQEFLEAAREMGFKARPDYAAMQKCFRKVREQQGIKNDWELQWLLKPPAEKKDKNKEPVDFQTLVEMEMGAGLMQPDDTNGQGDETASWSFWRAGGAKRSVFKWGRSSSKSFNNNNNTGTVRGGSE